jgi:hypothetical protein
MRFLALTLLALPVLADSDLRQVSWGMSPEQVRAAESGEAAEISGGLRYPAQDLLKTGNLSYYFEGGKLIRAVYVFASKHDDLDQFIADFHTVSKQLVAQRRAASCERVIWLDDSLQLERMPYLIQDRAIPATIMASDPQIGLSLSLGHFQMIEAWVTPRTQISHTITGSEGRITHRVEFRSAAAAPDPAIEACRAE